MGRVTEFIEFINEDVIPNNGDVGIILIYNKNR